MHLKPCPKLVRSELRLDAVGVQTPTQRTSLFVSQQGGLLRTCTGNHGNIGGSRFPFSVISTNTLRCTNAPNGGSGTTVMSLRLKAPPSATLQLLPPPLGYENNTTEQYQTATEDADAPLDIWTVIKPGHVREKIAIFASDGPSSGERTLTGGSSGRDRAAVVCTNHTAMTGLWRAVKAKGSWEENCSAKRRRRSGNNHNLQQDQRTRVLEVQHLAFNPSPRRSDSSQQPGGGEEVAAEEEEQKVSVVEMVAFLEQRVSEQQPDSKPQLTLQRSSTTITLFRAPPPEVRGEESESIRVSDMVAKLESECLRRRTEGDLSRNNSLRRTVGRVLLATGDQNSAPCQPSSSVTSPTTQLSLLPGAQSLSREPVSCQTVSAETLASALTTPPSPGPPTPPSEVRGPEAQTVALPPNTKEAEPLPGLLFLSPPLTDSNPASTGSEPRPPRHRTTLDLKPVLSKPHVPISPSPSDSGSQSEKKRRRRADGVLESEVAGVALCSATVPLSRQVSASQDFLEKRQRLQQLLEPQPFLAAPPQLAVLPHHLLVKILLLLPTQSLAALKCSCSYFKFVIETYGVRPADSLWVSDPRYRDDPCKQCKKRYGRGDVSLCRWHHKPYCQALPYGPGYWMCCHGARRDAPGCNVGLHDNRWVPAFHSINVPIYRRSRNHDN